MPYNRAFIPEVVILGPFKSGTHAMRDYLRHFSRCDLPTDENDDGWCMIPGWGTIWKHDPILKPFVFPEQVGGRPVVIIVMVREILRWLNALSVGAYEVFPCGPNKPKKRRHGVKWWLAEEEVELRHIYIYIYVYINWGGAARARQGSWRNKHSNNKTTH